MGSFGLRYVASACALRRFATAASRSAAVGAAGASTVTTKRSRLGAGTSGSAPAARLRVAGGKSNLSLSMCSCFALVMALPEEEVANGRCTGCEETHAGDDSADCGKRCRYTARDLSTDAGVRIPEIAQELSAIGDRDAGI